MGRPSRVLYRDAKGRIIANTKVQRERRTGKYARSLFLEPDFDLKYPEMKPVPFEEDSESERAIHLDPDFDLKYPEMKPVPFGEGSESEEEDDVIETGGSRAPVQINQETINQFSRPLYNPGGDGNCFYNTAWTGLYLMDYKPRPDTAMALKYQLLGWISTHADDENVNRAIQSQDNFNREFNDIESYLAWHSQSGQWADQGIVYAFTRVYNNITVALFFKDRTGVYSNGTFNQGQHYYMKIGNLGQQHFILLDAQPRSRTNIMVNNPKKAPPKYLLTDEQQERIDELIQEKSFPSNYQTIWSDVLSNEQRQYYGEKPSNSEEWTKFANDFISRKIMPNEIDLGTEIHPKAKALHESKLSKRDETMLTNQKILRKRELKAEGVTNPNEIEIEMLEVTEIFNYGKRNGILGKEYTQADWVKAKDAYDQQRKQSLKKKKPARLSMQQIQQISESMQELQNIINEQRQDKDKDDDMDEIPDELIPVPAIPEPPKPVKRKGAIRKAPMTDEEMAKQQEREEIEARERYREEHEREKERTREREEDVEPGGGHTERERPPADDGVEVVYVRTKGGEKRGNQHGNRYHKNEGRTRQKSHTAKVSANAYYRAPAGDLAKAAKKTGYAKATISRKVRKRLIAELPEELLTRDGKIRKNIKELPPDAPKLIVFKVKGKPRRKKK